MNINEAVTKLMKDGWVIEMRTSAGEKVPFITFEGYGRKVSTTMTEEDRIIRKAQLPDNRTRLDT